MTTIVLASASPRRRELLAQAGVDFRVDPAHVDETIPQGTAAEAAAVGLAERKALAVARRSAGPVLAADTIVAAADGGILGKPASTTEAREMLSRLAGTTHRVVTGVCLALDGGRRCRTACDTTFVTMRQLTNAEIDAYASSGEPFGKAGGYAIQESGDRFVTHVGGSWTNVVGLPMELVLSLLREEGVV
ncbi:MAG: Maf family protein [Planctomycetes bacterium]|nr:Maf family protein [Planctomycetota bacterium]